MPSPFPGMDPYLENPGLWPDVHNEFISEARAYLGSRLRPKYTVRIEERLYMSGENDPGRTVIAPDIHIAIRPGGQYEPFDPGNQAGVEVAEPIVATTMMILDEIHEARLEIVDREQRRVVTVVEVLSPADKVLGARGRESYELKRQEVMDSRCHLVEIDLLRGGVGLLAKGTIPPCEYLVHLSRVAKRPKGLLWPIRLSQRLPVIPVPLMEGDPDALLDLQAVLSTAYDRAGYDLSVDYAREPLPPLSPDWAAWSDRRLKAKGLRPA